MGFEAAGGGGGLVPLRSVTASSQATVDFDQGNLDTTYRLYLIVLTGVSPGDNDTDLYCRVSTDGGSTYEDGASAYSWMVHEQSLGGTNTSGNSSHTRIELMRGDVGTQDAEGVGMRLWLYHPAQADEYTKVHAFSINDQPVGGPPGGLNSVRAGGRRSNAESNDAFQLFFQSGNVNDGQLDLYGVRQP